MCSKLKLVKFSNRTLRSSVSTPAIYFTDGSSSIDPSDVTPTAQVLNEDILAPPETTSKDIPAPPEATPALDKENSLLRDPAIPLSEEEMHKILSSCETSSKELEPTRVVLPVGVSAERSAQDRA